MYLWAPVPGMPHWEGAHPGPGWGACRKRNAPEALLGGFSHEQDPLMPPSDSFLTLEA